MKEEINIKTPSEIKLMMEGGKKLGRIKKKLIEAIKEGVSAKIINRLAEELIEKEGGKASFKMVDGYSWGTCVNVNDGIVHGIPHESIIFKNGDIVSVDVGIYYKGFHTDMSFTVGISPSESINSFLSVGKVALKRAIEACRSGNRVYDISKEIEETLEKSKLSPIKTLVGHGIGRDLHEAPQIPCFTKGKRQNTPEIVEGAVFAVEVMYAQGSPETVMGSDGWTISAQDGKIAALFEETVAVTGSGPVVLTKSI